MVFQTLEVSLLFASYLEQTRYPHNEGLDRLVQLDQDCSQCEDYVDAHADNHCQHDDIGEAIGV